MWNWTKYFWMLVIFTVSFIGIGWTAQAPVGMSGGVLLSEGYEGGVAFGINFTTKVPVVGGNIYPEVLYTQADDAEYIGKVYTHNEKSLGIANLYAGMGAGLWYIADGPTLSAYKLDFTWKYKAISIGLCGEVAVVPHGDELFYPHLKFAWTP